MQKGIGIDTPRLRFHLTQMPLCVNTEFVRRFLIVEHAIRSLLLQKKLSWPGT
jgi:hypothetical protein